MAELHSLIRLYKWRLDEKRRALAELQGLADRLMDERQRLAAQVRTEQDIARHDTEASFSYARYARTMIDRRKRLEESIAQVQQQIDAATAEMAEAFQELKRFELAQESRDRREQARQRSRETAMLDEVALTGFQRRREDG